MKHESALVISLLCRLVGIGRQEGLFQVDTIKNYRGRNKSATRETL
jgi:hypothetical protein